VAPTEEIFRTLMFVNHYSKNVDKEAGFQLDEFNRQVGGDSPKWKDWLKG